MKKLIFVALAFIFFMSFAHALDVSATGRLDYYRSNEVGYENRVNALPLVKAGPLWYFGDISMLTPSGEALHRDMRYSNLTELALDGPGGLSIRYMNENLVQEGMIRGHEKKTADWRDNRVGLGFVDSRYVFGGALKVWNELIYLKADREDYRAYWTLRSRYKAAWLDNQYYYDTTDGKKSGYRNRTIVGYDLTKAVHVLWRSEWKPGGVRVNFVGAGWTF